MKLSDILQSKIHSARNNPEKARCYIRVSHERNAEKAISPETQRKRIESYAAEHGYEIAGWYVELAKSALRGSEGNYRLFKLSRLQLFGGAKGS